MEIFVLVLAVLTVGVYGVCPPFLSNENSCNCSSFVDGLMIHCVGPEATQVIEKLKLYDVYIRELSIHQANIKEVSILMLTYVTIFLTDWLINSHI
ncbi:unnamed protein product [Soboliphyme baturini]|uniref:LRRNT domain-containing protein n=1 Tax=Soboliphyme baturini TaxID=241478 RepID=A0A183JAU0_9BILA|nr:unnamed protein product [Soboliphyme baturini]